ncbi:MAG: hypothetical protein LBN29_10665, partial [Mediterranea sp.]|nr:hypothetical protein [Mediterranea sp.]
MWPEVLSLAKLGAYGRAAVYYDWDKPAVERLREILDTTGAKIVLSTTWRRMGIPIMRALMAIHHLDSYLVDSTFCITHEEAQKSPPP